MLMTQYTLLWCRKLDDVPVISKEATQLHNAPFREIMNRILERQNHKQSDFKEGWIFV